MAIAMGTTKNPHDITSTLTVLRGQTLSVPNVRIRVTPPGGAPTETTLGLRPLVFGKGSNCDVVVLDPGISSKHCELSLTSRGIVLRDLGSKNGTFIGGIQISEGILPAGVVASIGHSVLVARIEGSPS